jgi:hypothetical protein
MTRWPDIFLRRDDRGGMRRVADRLARERPRPSRSLELRGRDLARASATGERGTRWTLWYAAAMIAAGLILLGIAVVIAVS